MGFWGVTGAAAIVLMSASTVSAHQPPVGSTLLARPLTPGLRAQEAAPAVSDDSVAVIPFSNITRAPGDAWIGSGIAETVMADLVRVGGLTVIDRQVVLDALRELNASEGEERMALALGRQLGATWVLRGGYQRLGDQIQITARFVDVATGDVVQTMNVDGAASGLFALQDQIVAELSARLNPAAEAVDRTVTPVPLPRGPGARGPSRALTVGVSGNIGGV